jgi:Mrp family chromosome partitioning ATPase
MNPGARDRPNELTTVKAPDAAERSNAAPDSDFMIEFESQEQRSRQVFEETTRVVPVRPHPVLGAALTVGSPASEEFRILVARIRSVAAGQPLRCMGVVSASPEEGKTTVAVGMAVAMAQEPSRRVLVLEADLRNPAIESYLGLHREAGLGDWLEGTSSRLVVRRVMPQGFFLLPAGRFLARQPGLLASDRMASLLALARVSFDSVILDCPPLISVADSLLLQDLLDGFLVVVRARHSPLETITKAVSQLKPEKVSAVVFNDYREVRPSYYSYAQRRYPAHR